MPFNVAVFIHERFCSDASATPNTTSDLVLILFAVMVKRSLSPVRRDNMKAQLKPFAIGTEQPPVLSLDVRCLQGGTVISKLLYIETVMIAAQLPCFARYVQYHSGRGCLCSLSCRCINVCMSLNLTVV